MLEMLLKMFGATGLYVLVTLLVWRWKGKGSLSGVHKVIIGVIYGAGAILSTHFGVDYSHMLLNVRDIGPLAAGLFFDPISGILAGLIGGVERYIAGTYWGVGAYTRIACSVSTCLAGFVSAGMSIWIFQRKKPSAVYAFLMGAVMEVFHMYVVFITHRGDMNMAFYVVRTCSGPMIVFTGLGLAVSSVLLQVLSKEWKNPFRHLRQEEVPLSRKFQFWLLAVTVGILVVNFGFTYALQTQSAIQEARDDLKNTAEDVLRLYKGTDGDRGFDTLAKTVAVLRIGSTGTVDVVAQDGAVFLGPHAGQSLPKDVLADLNGTGEGYATAEPFGEPAICRTDSLQGGWMLLSQLPSEEVYSHRDAQAYETAFAAILLFSVIYVLISTLVQQIVVHNLELVNDSLSKITGGNLNEVVNVRSASEFASLSDDINQTVTVLKGYITAAEKRIEQELEFARTIQDSALPKNFTFPRRDFSIYATMDPAKEVGGDFYDFFFVDRNRVAMVIADVSGKGIPAALFMMRAKTALRGFAEGGKAPAEILYRVNNTLCEGNDAEMFVTVWIGIIDLETGVMICSNAGHEYPALMRAGGEFELFRDKHGLALAAMENMRFREYELQLRPGDRLFVYTDGIPEALNSATEQYGTDRLLQILNARSSEPLDTVLPEVRRDIADFAGEAEQFDDITMLGFDYHGPDDKSV